MERSLLNFIFPDGFCLSFNEKHWSNKTNTIRLIEEILVSYIKKVKEQKDNLKRAF